MGKSDASVHPNARRVRQYIKTLRVASNLSQTEMARRMGVSRPFYTQLETGIRRMSIDYMFHIADALQVHPETILQGTL